MEKTNKVFDEIIFKARRGFMMLFAVIAAFIGSFVMIIVGSVIMEGGSEVGGAVLLILGLLLMLVTCIAMPGFKIVNPNEAIVLVLFGKYRPAIKSQVKTRRKTDSK